MTAPDVPELEDIVFYQQLTTVYSDSYLKAQETCSIIVIPHNSPPASMLTRDIIESHLFRPSPMYIRKHVSCNDKYEIEFDNNRTIRIFYKKEGVGERRVKILSQEDVRDSARQRTYSILIVEQPIIESVGLKNSSNGSANSLTNKSSIPSVKF